MSWSQNQKTKIKYLKWDHRVDINIVRNIKESYQSNQLKNYDCLVVACHQIWRHVQQGAMCRVWGTGSMKSLQSLWLSNAKMPISAEIGKTEKGTSWMQEKRSTQILHLVCYSGIIPGTPHWRCSTVIEWTTLHLMGQTDCREMSLAWLDEFRWLNSM